MSLDTEPIYFFQLKKEIELPEAVVFGGFSISMYRICLVIAALLGILLTVLEVRKKGHEPEDYLTVLCLVLLFGCIGGRVFYVLFHYSFFEDRFLWSLDLRTGGLSFYGAMFGAWISVKEYCRRKKADFSTVVDALCSAAAWAAIPVWFGCVLQKEPFGRYYSGLFSMAVRTDFLFQHNARLPMKGFEQNTIVSEGVSYTCMHPVALYGFVLSIIVAVILQLLKRYVKQEGDLFLLYLFLTAVENLVLSLFLLDGGDFFGIRLPMITILSVLLIILIPLHFVFQGKQKPDFFKSK